MERGEVRLDLIQVRRICHASGPRCRHSSHNWNGALRCENGGTEAMHFGVHVRNDNLDRPPSATWPKSVRGPADDGVPAVTVTMPDEGQLSDENVGIGSVKSLRRRERA